MTTDEVLAAALESAAACFSDEDVERYDAEADFLLWHVARDDGYGIVGITSATFTAAVKNR